MARYIDAVTLYKKLYPLDLVDKKLYTINAKAVADAIDKTPTADVVEVVRCKDCQFAYIDGNRAYCRNIETPWYNDYFEVFTETTDFCSYGTPKERR